MVEIALMVVVVVVVVIVVVVVVVLVMAAVELVPSEGGHPTFGGELMGVTPSGQHPNGDEHWSDIPVVLETLKRER